MIEVEGYWLARILVAIFKNRPSRGYAAFALVIVIVLGVMLLSAQSPSDRAFPLLGLIFVSIVVLSEIIQSIRQESVQDFQELDETLFEDEPPQSQGINSIYSQSWAEEKQPEYKPPPSRGGDHLSKAPAKKSPVLIRFLRYLRCAPSTILKTLSERHLVEASVEASKFSGALLLVSIALPFGLGIPCLLVAALLPADFQMIDPLYVAMIAQVLVGIIMLLSALVALGLAFVAIFSRWEDKASAGLALFLSVFMLICALTEIAYGIAGIGSSSFGG